MTETIEGTAVDVTEERALTVQQPGNALVARPQDGPADMIQHATRLATALSDIVERQSLYSVISGKKFPKVEAWMTIGRMDNVVAREAEPPVRHEDASYEAFVELIRLSDGMVIGRASALCGTQDDRPWNTRGEPARRAMAVTRATSRAFRMQYSWIMALAGYEPTPAEEMEGAQTQAPVAPLPPSTITVGHQEVTTDGGLIGTAVTKDRYDMNLRETAEGWVWPFRIKNGSTSFGAVAENALAQALDAIKSTIIDQRVTVWGRWSDEVTPAKGTRPEVKWRLLHVDRIATPDGILPAPGVDEPPEDVPLVGEAATAPLFDDVA